MGCSIWGVCCECFCKSWLSLQWHHNGHHGVSNHQPHHCSLKRLFRRRSKKHQSSASLAFVRGIHQWPVNSLHKWPVTRKLFPFDDIIIVCPVCLGLKLYSFPSSHFSCGSQWLDRWCSDANGDALKTSESSGPCYTKWTAISTTHRLCGIPRELKIGVESCVLKVNGFCDYLSHKLKMFFLILHSSHQIFLRVMCLQTEWCWDKRIHFLDLFV